MGGGGVGRADYEFALAAEPSSVRRPTPKSAEAVRPVRRGIGEALFPLHQLGQKPAARRAECEAMMHERRS